MILRTVATGLFGLITFILTAMASGLISANVRKAADKHGWDNFLVRWTEKFRWERVRGLWWLWSLFGLSGGVAVVLWLTPLFYGPPASLGAQSNSTTGQAVKPKFVNPIHEEAVKWKLARDLSVLSSKINSKCEAVVVRYQMPYSEHYADDLIDILNTVGWNVKQTFASGQLPNDLSLRTLESGISRACGEALKQRLDNTAETRTSSLHTPLTFNPMTPYMNACSSQCVEIDIGNDPQS